MLCAKCKGTYEGYDSCPACAERDEKRARRIEGSVGVISFVVGASFLVSLLALLLR